MELRKSNRSQAKIRIALQGTSGSGKTYSSLLLAYGLCQDWTKLAVIDTENKSADLYSHLGNYNVLTLLPPFSPERYMEAIQTCENSGIQAIIIDSISHEWEAEGGILDIHGNMAGNSFANWAKITPRHNALVQKILNSSAHVIATVRTKQDYIITEKNGKQVPEKVGLKAVQRDGLEYDFTIVFELDTYNQATSSKDRTQLFSSRIPFKIDQSTGQKIVDWCNRGGVQNVQGELPIESKINSINDLQELFLLYRSTPEMEKYLDLFTKRADVLRKPVVPENPLNFFNNGKPSY